MHRQVQSIARQQPGLIRRRRAARRDGRPHIGTSEPKPRRAPPPHGGHPGQWKRRRDSTTTVTKATSPRHNMPPGPTRCALACRICLNLTRFWQCSPVATQLGSIARAMVAWPNTSSGLVGSSTQCRLNGAKSAIQSIACGTSHTWFASIISFASGPMPSRPLPSRRMSPPRFSPTLPLPVWWPSSPASRSHTRTLAALLPELPLEPVRNLRKLLEAYADLLARTRQPAPAPVRGRLRGWRTQARLKKIIVPLLAD